MEGGQPGALGYLDLEIEIDPDTGQGNPLTVRSPGGEAKGTLRLPFDKSGLETRLRALEATVRRQARDARSVLPAAAHAAGAADAKAFGQALFEALLPAAPAGARAARDCYVRSREIARQGRRGLRLRLRVRDAALAVLPWEFLYDAATGGYLCLSLSTPVVRHHDGPGPSAPLPVTPPLRVLGLVAGPPGLPALDASRERGWVEAALAPLLTAGLAELVWVQGQTWRALREALLAGPWHVFHFVGHGGVGGVGGLEDGYLALADEADPGTVYRLGTAELGMLLRDQEELRLVVLNACEGARGAGRGEQGAPGEPEAFPGTAAALVRTGPTAVVAMRYPISDGAAVEFARALYGALARSLPVDAAVGAARQSMRLEAPGSLEWATPALYMRAPDAVLFAADSATAGPTRPDGPAAASLLATLPLDRVPTPAPLPPRSRMPLSPSPQFVGREEELRAVAAKLKHNKIVAVTGIPGTGKTRFAAEVVHRFGRYFAGGVFWLSFADPADLGAEVAACGGAEYLDLLGPSPGAGASPPDKDELVKRVRAAWRDGPPRLLVFDNCEDEGLLEDWRPTSGACRVLLTSRRADWDQGLGVHPVPLPALPRADSVRLLAGHGFAAPEDRATLDRIAAELGDLPLALRLAGRHLARYRDVETPDEYLQQLRASPDALDRSLAEGGTSSAGREQSVRRAFALSYERLRSDHRTDRDARHLLARAAYFAPGESIPSQVLYRTLSTDSAGRDARLAAAQALRQLVQLGLVE
jgi:hypothetical protein